MKLNDRLTRHGLIKMGGTAEVFDDMTGSPGPKMLMYGDMDAGFFGVVPNNEFMPVEDVILELGSTTGRQRNLETEWFKFASEGKILFKTVKPAKRHDYAHNNGSLEREWGGGQILEFDGNLYKSRFMKGIQDNSKQDERDRSKESYQAKFNDTEFTKLMLPLFENARDNGFIRDVRNQFIMKDRTDFWPIKGGVGLNQLDIGVRDQPSDWVSTELLSHKNTKLYVEYLGWTDSVRLSNNYSTDGKEINLSFSRRLNSHGSFGWWIILELVE